MKDGFDLATYLAKSTQASGVPLTVRHAKAVKAIARLLKSQ